MMTVFGDNNPDLMNSLAETLREYDGDIEQ